MSKSDKTDVFRPGMLLGKITGWLRQREFAWVIFLVGTFMISLMAVSAMAAAGPAEPRLVQLSQVNFGTLLLRSDKPGKYVEAPLVASDVEINVTGIVARAVITQRFRNPAKGWVEGKYVFPLPENAAVDTLKMMIGKRFIEGKLKERKEAKIIYEKAKAEGQKAALVEQERPNMFTNSVANIGPRETVVVQLEYQHEVRLDNGEYRMRVPLVVAPRYLPKPVMHLVSHTPGRTTVSVSNPVPDADRITPPVQHPEKGKRNPVSMSIRLDPGFGLGEVKSPHHQIAIKREGPNAALVGLADGEVWADREFELTWQASPGNEPKAALFRETVDGASYLLAMINPPQMSANKPVKPREVVFVIDNSGSMSGQSMRQAKEGLLYALGRLNPSDSFNVIRFDDTMDQLFPSAVQANTANIANAKRFVGTLKANGGTEILPALKAALVDANPEDARLRQVVFLTDGAIGNESQLFSAIQSGLGRSRIFTVGIGSAPNSFFMTRAATYGRGAFTHISQTSQVKMRMAELVRKLEQPVMTDLQANWPLGTDPESWPNPLPDLYAGEPIVLTARMDKLESEVLLTGSLDGKPWSLKLPVSSAKEGKGISRLWARRKIMALEGGRYQVRDWKAYDAKLLDVALKYGLVSRLTSLVAVDVTSSRPESAELATSDDVPLNLPQGWNFEKVFGEGLPLIDGHISPPSIRQAALIKAVDTKPVITKSKPKGMSLPAGATTADMRILMGLISLVMAGLLMLMLVFRRRGQTFLPNRGPV